MTLPAVPVSQTPEEKFREYLASRPKVQRYTGQQRDLVQHIFATHDHFDADALIDDVRKAGLSVSRATVYRTLTKLVDAGMLRRIEVETRTVYERDYGYPHHDHLVCEVCDKMIEFQSETIETAVREMAEKWNFQMSGHTLILRGICQECQKARQTRRRLDMI